MCSGTVFDIIRKEFAGIFQAALAAIAGFGAVSYTHLDVYKRQVFSSSASAGAAAAPAAATGAAAETPHFSSRSLTRSACTVTA